MNYNLRCVFFPKIPVTFSGLSGGIPHGFQTFTLSHWQLESWEHSSAIEASELLGTHAEGLDGLPSGGVIDEQIRIPLRSSLRPSANFSGFFYVMIIYDSFGVSHGGTR